MGKRRKKKEEKPKNFFSYLRNSISKIPLADKIAFIALITSLFGMLFSIFQFSETKKQFQIERADGFSKDSAESIRFNKKQEEEKKKENDDRDLFLTQLKEIRTKNSKDIEYYNKQLDLSAASAEINRQYLNSQLEEYQQAKSNNQTNFLEQKRKDSLHLNISIQPQMTVESATGSYDTYSGIFISNVGLGPAKITKLEVYYKSNKLTDFSALGREITYDHPGLIKNEKYFYWDLWDTTFTMTSGRKLWLFYINNPEVKYPEDLYRIFKYDVRIDLEYKSFTNQTYKHSWFRKL